ncbi:MAG TPA: hypothetical protein VJ276_14630 [Thermoanaerobaculia bacterium]|nr:hypothetical protein [Thermoanaerobaculia bacterium]
MALREHPFSRLQSGRHGVENRLQCFTNTIRLALVGAAIIGGLATYSTSPTRAGLFIGGAVLLIVGYLRQGTVWLAFRAQRQGRTSRSKKLLEQIANPDRLSRQNRAYYYFLRGIHTIEAAEYAAADALLEHAPVGDLRTDNDRSMATALRAAAALALGDRDRAKIHLLTAREYPRRPEVTALLDEIEGDLGSAP